MGNFLEFCKFCPVYLFFAKIPNTEAGKHLFNAKKEVLFALKSVIEKEIEKIDKMGKKEKARKVEVS
ncbi:MAG: hypothetical protein AB1410_00615 [Acidobacteriota bacterium]